MEVFVGCCFFLFCFLYAPDTNSHSFIDSSSNTDEIKKPKNDSKRSARQEIPSRHVTITSDGSARRDRRARHVT